MDGCLAAVAINGCSNKLACSFGPAVISGVWSDQWVPLPPLPSPLFDARYQSIIRSCIDDI